MTPQTALAASLLAFVYVALALRIIALRWKTRTGIGDGGHATLARAIRVHGNFSEYVPLGLILLFLLEQSGAQPGWVGPLCGALVLGRLLHAFGLSRSAGASVPRFVGMVLTFTALVVPAGLLLRGAAAG